MVTWGGVQVPVQPAAGNGGKLCVGGVVRRRLKKGGERGITLGGHRRERYNGGGKEEE